MARSRSPDREKARLYWLSSGCKAGNTEIGEHLGVAAKSVARWRKDDNWSAYQSGQNSGQNTGHNSPKNGQNGQNKKARRGAPAGNRNAAGHGAPKGNINNLVTGKYSKRYWDFVNDEEIEMLSEFDDGYFKDAELLLIDQIRLFTIRERRLMEMIRAVKEKGQKDGQPAPDVMVDSTMVLTVPSNTTKDGKPVPRVKSTMTRTENKAKLIISLEEQLSRVQEKKTRTIMALNDVHSKRNKQDIKDTGQEMIQIYLPSNSR